MVQMVRQIKVWGLFISMLTLASAWQPATAQEQDGSKSPSSFLPIWRHLSPEQKRNFISGYVQGWRDASVVTDIALTYVRQEPQQAITGLERLKAVYDLSDVNPSDLVPEIDRFYADPTNSQAALSLAISAARAGARSVE